MVTTGTKGPLETVEKPDSQRLVENVRCKASEIPRNEAYIEVRRNDEG
jgi:hypothetical protein